MIRLLTFYSLYVGVLDTFRVQCTFDVKSEFVLSTLTSKCQGIPPTIPLKFMDPSALESTCWYEDWQSSNPSIICTRPHPSVQSCYYILGIRRTDRLCRTGTNPTKIILPARFWVSTCNFALWIWSYPNANLYTS